jgi:hypothetical protein
MVGNLDNPVFWRFRAEEARTIAGAMTHPDTKAIMLKIADEYDRIANITQDLLKAEKS